jgi:glycerol-3-phosphate dehydrogenase
MNSHSRNPKCLSEGYDVIIVGGGITGTGIARDASRRGLSVLLLEQEDFGYGTTARSSRLVHGGLRYLAHLDFGIVRQDLKEREILLHHACHLVRPISFLIPLYGPSTFRRFYLGAGLTLYDLLARGSSLSPHKWLSRSETLNMELSLEPRELKGAFRYADAQVDMPERLCVENLLDATDHGATVFNYVRATGFTRNADGITGVEVEDLVGGDRYSPHAKMVVSATGPWAGEILGPTGDGMLRLSQGSHLVTDGISQNAIVTLSERDGRLLFVIPWLGRSLIGTTDVEYTGDASSVRPTGLEIRYLKESIRGLFPNSASSSTHYSMAGLRALVPSRGGRTSNVSRTHKVVAHQELGGPQGLVSVFGGKLTSYRLIAEQATDAVCRCLRHNVPCNTREAPLPGAHNWHPAAANVEQIATEYALAPDTVRHLSQLYGARMDEVLGYVRDDPATARPLFGGSPEIVAQVRHAVLHEGAQKVADVLLRRCTTGLGPDQGREAVATVAEEMRQLLGWGPGQVAEQVVAYERTLARDFPQEIEGACSVPASPAGSPERLYFPQSRPKRHRPVPLPGPPCRRR